MAEKETETVTSENGKIQLNLLEPRATEKTYGEQMKRYYVFPVEKSMSKQAVAKMIEKEFNVTVTEVKTLVRKGKKTRYSKGKHAYPGTTYRRDRKFAYVRLAKGDSIPVFEEQKETSAKDAKKRDKILAKAEKEVAKEKAREEKAAVKAEKATGKAKKSEADKNAGKENK